MYVSPSEPLPQNSLMPLPTAVVNAANARKLRDFWQSRTGRERVYSTIPTAESLWPISPALAVDAKQRLGQSESARQSVLIGLGLPNTLPDASLIEVQNAAPTVVSLNAPTTTGGLDSTQTGMMPSPAPIPTIGNLWGSAKRTGGNTGNGQRGVTGLLTRNLVGGASGAGKWQGSADLGPGCSPPIPMPTPVPLPAMPSPPPAANPPSPASLPAARPPTYANICWALRNGVVLQSQVPSAVGLKCLQLGYYAGCETTPPNAAAWIAQETAAGNNFPPIAVSDSDLAAIPPAPANLTTLSCAQSWQLGGLSGVALDWGDAGTVQSEGQGGSSLVNTPLLLLLGLGVAFVIWDKKKGRR